MTRIEIRIEGYLMDVDDKVGNIATTFQVFDFKSIGSIKADRTNRLTLPITNNNVFRLEQIAPLSVITTKPYQNLSIQVVQDGQSVITNGVCQIVSIQDRISLDIQSGIKGFWDSLEGLYLNDIDTSAWDGLWDNDRHDTVRNATSGLVCPVVNTGQLVDGTTYVNGYTYGAAMIPFFYYSTIIDQIFTLVGFDKTGTIFSDTNRYSKLAMSTRLVYNKEWENKIRKRFTFDDATVGPGPLGSGAAIRLNGVSGPGTDGFWSWDPTIYITFDTGDAVTLKTIRVKVTVSARVTLTSGLLSSFALSVSDGSTTVISTLDGNIATAVLYTDLENAGLLIFTYGLSDGSIVQVSDGTINIDLVNTTDTDRVQSTDWHWYFNQLLPRWTLKSFIVDFMKMFGLLITEKNNVVTFKTISEILTEIAPSTVELSRENKDRKPLINYNLSGFGQVNNFYWIVQDDELIITDAYGLGKFAIDNSTLPESKDLYTSLFTASDQVTETRINQAAQITIYDQSGPAFTKAASFGARLVLLRADDGVNFRFKAGTSRTDYFIGYFIDKNQTYNLDFQELVDEYYPEYATVLNRWATVQQEYFISLVESAQMDLTKPVTKDGIRYLIEKVNSYVPGKFAKFDLIRI